MSNSYYTHGSFPSTGSAATSGSMRAELDLISAGFDKLPVLTGNANKFVVVNATGTALVSTSVFPAATVQDTGFTVVDDVDGTKAFQFQASSITTGTTRVFTMPDASTELVGTNTTQTFTNKTINAANNTLSNIPNSALTNNSITINGTAVALGGSISVGGSSSTLTIGTGLSGGSYNGGSAVTIAIDSTVVTLTGTQTLTNKTLTSPVISGGSVDNTPIGATTTNTGAFTTLNVGAGKINATANRVNFNYGSGNPPTTLSYAASVSPDFNLANNFYVQLTGNMTLANPTNITTGQHGAIVLQQDATGSRTIAFGSYWKFPGGTAPSLTTTANAYDVLVYYVDNSSRVSAKLLSDVK